MTTRVCQAVAPHRDAIRPTATIKMPAIVRHNPSFEALICEQEKHQNPPACLRTNTPLRLSAAHAGDGPSGAGGGGRGTQRERGRWGGRGQTSRLGTQAPQRTGTGTGRGPRALLPGCRRAALPSKGAADGLRRAGMMGRQVGRAAGCLLAPRALNSSLLLCFAVVNPHPRAFPTDCRESGREREGQRETSPGGTRRGRGLTGSCAAWCSLS